MPNNDVLEFTEIFCIITRPAMQLCMTWRSLLRSWPLWRVLSVHVAVG